MIFDDHPKQQTRTNNNQKYLVLMARRSVQSTADDAAPEEWTLVGGAVTPSGTLDSIQNPGVHVIYVRRRIP